MRPTAKRMDVLQRRAKVAELVVAGLPVWQIGEQLGVSSRTVERDIEHLKEDAIARMRANADDHRAQHLQRLDALWEAFWPKAQQGHDKAGTVCLRILSQRSELLGYSEPTRVSVSWEKVEQWAAEYGLPISTVIREVRAVQESPELQRLLPPGVILDPISGPLPARAQVVDGHITREERVE